MTVLQGVKYRITVGPSNSSPRYMLKELKTETKTDTYVPVLIATLSPIAKRQKQSKYSPTDVQTRVCVGGCIMYKYIIYI